MDDEYLAGLDEDSLVVVVKLDLVVITSDFLLILGRALNARGRTFDSAVGMGSILHTDVIDSWVEILRHILLSFWVL